MSGRGNSPNSYGVADRVVFDHRLDLCYCGISDNGPSNRGADPNYKGKGLQGVIAAVANITTKRKSRCLRMTCLLFMV